MAVDTRRILFVLTSSDTLGESGEPTGLWLDEFTVPYYALRDAGFQVDVVSIRGGRVPIDPRSAEDTSITANRRYQADAETQAVVEATPSIEEVDFADYAALFLPGGHGTMWDLPESTTLAAGVAALYAAGKPVAAVCHGPAGLVGAQGPDGQPLVRGKRVSAFTTREEEAVGLEKVVPFLLDRRLEALGAELVRGEPFTETAVADGNLITGQNPQSAGKVARLLRDALGPARS